MRIVGNQYRPSLSLKSPQGPPNRQTCTKITFLPIYEKLIVNCGQSSYLHNIYVDVTISYMLHFNVHVYVCYCIVYYPLQYVWLDSDQSINVETGKISIVL